ncbi:MAG: hypothetical protein PHN31_05760 [Candidatus Gracilibacteria bacterium]|nr:hypothetical protein [Candidatus Gracilibacteria bacterium]
MDNIKIKINNLGIEGEVGNTLNNELSLDNNSTIITNGNLGGGISNGDVAITQPVIKIGGQENTESIQANVEQVELKETAEPIVAPIIKIGGQENTESIQANVEQVELKETAEPIVAPIIKIGGQENTESIQANVEQVELKETAEPIVAPILKIGGQENTESIQANVEQVELKEKVEPIIAPVINIVDKGNTESIQLKTNQVEEKQLESNPGDDHKEEDLHGFGKKMVSLKSFFSSSSQHKDDKKKELKNEQVEKVEEVKKDLFVNYDSDFHRNEKQILKKIRGIRMLPKTNFAFIITLLVITTGIVTFLMSIDPKNHSLENYKTSLLNIATKVQTIVSNTGKDNPDDKGGNNNSTITGVTIVENNTNNNNNVVDNSTGGVNVIATGTITGVPEGLIKEKWFKVEADVINMPDGTKQYIYKGNTYTKDELQEQVKVELKTEIKNKTNEYLTKTYLQK